MAEYIEREATRPKAIYMYGFGENKYVPLKAIESIPAADVAPVRHGEWEIYREPEWPDWAMRLVCSACGLKTSQKSRYCPNCGAKMDGGTE